MIGTRGIDQEVQSKVDAYRGNPDALAQRYSQNQQLIDLLALQKLKSEKESAAREMQMKMGGQQMPTIAEARENEVLDLTKQELAQQATGAMQQQARQQQNAMRELIQRNAQMPQQSASPMMQGVAGIAAPNIAPQSMATGGIVAFDDGGPTGEAEAQAAQPPRPSVESLARQGIRTLFGTKTPEEVYKERSEAGRAAADYSPEERAIMQRQIADRAAYDARMYSPEIQRSEALTRFLLGAAGRTGIGSVLAGAGAGAENYKSAMREGDRQRMMDRQKQEASLVDVGPASRMAGMKYGAEGEKTATNALHYGVDAAARLEAAQLAAARAAGSPEDKKIAQAYQAFNQNPEVRSLLKIRDSSGLPIDAPENVLINQRIHKIASKIFGGRGLDPDMFIPEPTAASEAPPPKSSVLDSIKGILGLNPSTAPLGRVVDFSQVQRSAPQP